MIDLSIGWVEFDENSGAIAWAKLFWDWIGEDKWARRVERSGSYFEI